MQCPKAYTTSLRAHIDPFFLLLFASSSFFNILTSRQVNEISLHQGKILYMQMSAMDTHQWFLYRPIF